MKIQIWELRLYYDLFDVLFDKYTSIEETYIPELNISLNFYDNKLNIIKNSNNRYYNKNIFFERIKPILLKQKTLNKKDTKMYKDLIKSVNN